MSEHKNNSLNRRQFVRTAAIASTSLGSNMLNANSVGRQRPQDSVTSGNANPMSWGAIELAGAIKNKKISCEEVMQAHLKQVDALNPQFNALVARADPVQLLRQARAKDKELAAGHYHGWLHGMPMAIKDLANAEGFVTSNGSPIFKNNVAKDDSIHIARLKNAGCIVTAKTNVPEFGLGSHTYNPVYGTTLNAYDGKSSAGGSSGGAAVALALDMVSVADGSDFMGSLRNPGAFNNVIGFRPTPGLVPLSNSYVEELPCNGPMAGNVSDTAMLLSTMAGYDERSPSSLPMDPRQFADSLQRDVKGLRIGWLGDFNGYLPMEEGVLDVCENALKGFAKLGCEVNDAAIDFSMSELWQTWLTFRHWLNRGKLGELYANESLRAQLKPEAAWEGAGAEKLTALDVYKASSARARWYAAVAAALQEHDFLVLPCAQVFPFDANLHWPKSIAGKTMDTYHRWMEVVIPGTLSGCPVINVPAGFSKEGKPMGLQIIGPRYKDFSVLQIAFAYEQATRWNLDVVPPILRSNS